MSCDEEEIGNWDFPAAGWMQSIKDLCEVDCEMYNKHWEVAERFYIEAKAEKIKDYRENFWGIFELAKGSVFGWRYYRNADKQAKTPDWFQDELAFKLCQTNSWFNKSDRERPKKPKVSDKKTVIKRGFPETISFGECWTYLSINVKARTIRLEIENGNRSVSRWWESPLGVKFSHILHRTKWTGDCGGYAIYRSEYDDERDFEPTYTHIYGGPKFMKDFNKRRGW